MIRPIYALLIPVLFLLACIPYPYSLEEGVGSSVPDLPAAVQPLETEWGKYGAYYEFDDFYARSADLWGTVQTKYVVNKRIRILSVEGEAYASVYIPLHGSIATFIVSLTDSLGASVPVDSEKIESEYERSGLVVCPKTTPRSRIDIQIVQPDLHYYGGYIRTTRVARMAAAIHVPVTCHISNDNTGYADMANLFSFIPNMGRFQEFKTDSEFTAPLFEPPIVVKDGFLSIPKGPGLGLIHSEDLLKKARVVKETI